MPTEKELTDLGFSIDDSNVLLEYVSRLSPQWLAGFFDGEGCVSISAESSNGNTHLTVAISQKNPAPLVVISLKFNGKFGHHSKDKTHYVRWHGRECLPILRFIEDYVFVKRKEVLLGIEFASLIGVKGTQPSNENLCRRFEIMTDLKGLNQGS